MVLLKGSKWTVRIFPAHALWVAGQGSAQALYSGASSRFSTPCRLLSLTETPPLLFTMLPDYGPQERLAPLLSGLLPVACPCNLECAVVT